MSTPFVFKKKFSNNNDYLLELVIKFINFLTNFLIYVVLLFCYKFFTKKKYWLLISLVRLYQVISYWQNKTKHIRHISIEMYLNLLLYKIGIYFITMLPFPIKISKSMNKVSVALSQHIMWQCMLLSFHRKYHFSTYKIRNISVQIGNN